MEIIMIRLLKKGWELLWKFDEIWNENYNEKYDENFDKNNEKLTFMM